MSNVIVTWSRLEMDLIMFSGACSITDYDTDTVILTGGDSGDYDYGHDGLEDTLPSLKFPQP